MLVVLGFWPVFGQSWAQEPAQRPRLEKRNINQRKLTREIDSKGSRSGLLAKWLFGGLGCQSQKTKHFPETNGFLALPPSDLSIAPAMHLGFGAGRNSDLGGPGGPTGPKPLPCHPVGREAAPRLEGVSGRRGRHGPQNRRLPVGPKTMY